VPKPQKRSQSVQARIEVDGKGVYLGRWPSRRAADVARDRATLYLRLDRPLRQATEARKLGPASPAQLVLQAKHLEKKRTTSRFLGVSWHTKQKFWRATIKARGRSYGIAGLYNEEQAAVLRDRLALHLLGKGAVLNFPGRKLKAASYEQIQRELREARSASRYRGVAPRVVAQRDTWSAQIVIRQRGHFLGRYDTERQAAIAYDRAARHYLGRRARLNLPALARRYVPADAATLRAEAHAELKKTKHSRFHGVSRQRALWSASIVHRYQVQRLGSAFATEEEAAAAYDNAALRLHGRKAKLNFHPETGEELCGQRVRGRA